MKLIREQITTYIEKEGLSEFLLQEHNHFNLSYIWLSIQMIVAAYLARNNNALLGFAIPLLGLWTCSIIYTLWRKLRERRNHKKEDITKPSTKDNQIYAGIVLIGLPALGATGLAILTNTWIIFPIYIFTSIAITLIMLFFQQNDHVFIDLIRQVIKGWLFSWQAVLKTIPVLVIAIFLSLFSGDIWNLIDSLGWLEISILSLTLLLIMAPAAKNKEEWLREQIAQSLFTAETIVQRVFALSDLQKLNKDGFVSIEDLEDSIRILEWRDTNDICSYLFTRLLKRINRRYLLAVALSTLLIGFSFFVFLTLVFWILSPGLAKVGWLQVARPQDIQTLVPILKFSFFISTLQMATFLANLLDKPKENIIFTGILDKTANWISAISLYYAIQFPNSYIWKKFQRQRNGYIVKGYWYEVNGKLIVRDGLSDDQVKEICKEIDNTYVKEGDNANFQVYKYKKEITRDLEVGKENFNWHYVHKPKFEPAIFTRIPENIDFSTEEHLLGRDCLVQGKPIQDSWFGKTPIMAAIGRAIWDSDKGHHIMMHPSAWKIKDKEILNIEIRLFKNLPTSADYINLAIKSLQIARKFSGNLNTVNIFFPYRFEGNWSRDFQLTDDGQYLFTENRITKKITLE
jgi:hypothetical protein